MGGACGTVEWSVNELNQRDVPIGGSGWVLVVRW